MHFLMHREVWCILPSLRYTSINTASTKHSQRELFSSPEPGMSETVTLTSKFQKYLFIIDVESSPDDAEYRRPKRIR